MSMEFVEYKQGERGKARIREVALNAIEIHHDFTPLQLTNAIADELVNTGEVFTLGGTEVGSLLKIVHKLLMEQDAKIRVRSAYTPIFFNADEGCYIYLFKILREEIAEYSLATDEERKTYAKVQDLILEQLEMQSMVKTVKLRLSEAHQMMRALQNELERVGAEECDETSVRSQEYFRRLQENHIASVSGMIRGLNRQITAREAGK